MDICRGLRPEIRNETPQVLKELIQRCWDENPENRPTALEIRNLIPLSSDYLKSNNMAKLMEEAFPTLNLLSLPKSHPDAIYKSRLLPDLPDSQELVNLESQVPQVISGNLS